MTAYANIPDSEEKSLSSGITVEIDGRIRGFKKVKPKNGGAEFWSTQLTRPAKDAYSFPSVFSVNSPSKLGMEGDDISVICELAPYVRKKDGEEFFNVSLWVIE